MNGRIKKLVLIAFICATCALFRPDVYADDLVPENTDKIVLSCLEDTSKCKSDQNRELNIALELKNERKNYFNIQGLPVEFSDSEPKKVSVGTVFKLALDEFDFLSGVRKRIDNGKSIIEGYKQSFYLTGNVSFKKEKEKEAKPEGLIYKLKQNDVKWKFDIDPGDSEVSCIVRVGECLKFEGNVGDGTGFKAEIGFRF